LIILGPILFIIGIASFISAPLDNSRANNLNDMNNVVQTWTNQYKNAFAAESFSIQNVVSKNYVTMTQSHSADISDTGVNSYTPVKFFTTQNILPTTINWNDGLSQLFTFTGSGNASANFQITANLFNSYTTYDSRSTCQNNNGYYTNMGTCVYYYVFDGLCVKVSQTGGKYTPDATYGGSGCMYDNGFPPNLGKFYAGIYMKTSPSSINFPFNLNGVSYYVRHNNDPFVYAQYLTQGSMSFGLTPGQKVALGLILMAVGGFFMLPCILFIVVFAICFRRRRHQHHYDVIH